LVSLGGLTVGAISEPASSLEVVASPEPHRIAVEESLIYLRLNSSGQIAGVTEDVTGIEPGYPVFIDLRSGERINGPRGDLHVQAISESGKVFGLKNNHGFVWNPKTTEFQYLPEPLGYRSSTPVVVNDAGDKLFGNAFTGVYDRNTPGAQGLSRWTEWTLADGEWTASVDVRWEPPLGAEISGLAAVNDAGFLVGNLLYQTGGLAIDGGRCVRPAVWSPVTGEWLDLASGCDSGVNDINDLNQVLVSVEKQVLGGGSQQTFVIDLNSGGLRNIGRLPGDEYIGGSAINNLGQVVGSSSSNVNSGGYRVSGFFWDPITGKLTKLKLWNSFVPKALTFNWNFPTQINDAGLIVGNTWINEWVEDRYRSTFGTYFWDLNEAQSLPVLSIGDVEIVEGDSGRCRYASFPVTLSSPAHSAVTAKFSVISGQGATGAAAGTDFTSLSGTIRFTPRSNGETATQQKINICIKSDSVAEGDQEFTVELADVFGGAVPGSIIGTGTIIDDDDNPSALPSFSVGDVTVEEGDLSLGKSRVLRVPVTLSRSAATRISVEVAIVSSSAEALVDFTLPRITMVVTFEPNQVSKFVSIAVLPDFFAEGDESFLVRLSNASSVAAIDREQGAVTIQNDD